VTDETLRRADELLSELIETVETARALPMSASCVLPREHLLDLLDELRDVLPPEMDEARTVIATRERMLKEAYEGSADVRQRAVAEADTVLADAEHRAAQLLAAAQEQADGVVLAAQEEHARLVAATSVHKAAAHAAAVLRADAENYEAQISAEAQHYDAQIRSEADRYAREARSEAERYALKLTGDAEDYAEGTLDELSAVLHRAASTADQGRTALAQRRATAWSAGGQDARRHEDVEPSSISA
jgi:cell division septum initiation protein DivIVA